MKKRIISLCYRKIIDSSSQKAWDQLVFESSYKEFLLQSQFYNQEKKYYSFAELLINVPASEKLHFLVNAAVVPYIQQLNGRLPDILNTSGKHFLSFQNFRFEIINSAINNKAVHQVAIDFISEPMEWHDTIGDILVLSFTNAEQREEGIFTETLKLQPFLSIYSLKDEL